MHILCAKNTGCTCPACCPNRYLQNTIPCDFTQQFISIDQYNKLKKENETLLHNANYYADKYKELFKENEKLKADVNYWQEESSQVRRNESRLLFEIEEHVKQKRRSEQENVQLKAQLQQPDPTLRAELSNLLGCDNDNQSVFNVVSNLKDDNERLNHTVNDLMEVLKLRENRLAKINSNAVKLHSHLLRYSASKDILKGFDAFYKDCFHQYELSEEQKANVEKLAQFVIKVTPVIKSFEVNLTGEQNRDKNSQVEHCEISGAKLKEKITSSDTIKEIVQRLNAFHDWLEKQSQIL